MSYILQIIRSAQKSLSKIPNKDYLRLKKQIHLLAMDPLPSGSKKLKGREGWRLRVGNYRIINTIKNQELIVMVLDVGHRKDIYK